MLSISLKDWAKLLSTMKDKDRIIALLALSDELEELGANELRKLVKREYSIKERKYSKEDVESCGFPHAFAWLDQKNISKGALPEALAAGVPDYLLKNLQGVKTYNYGNNRCFYPSKKKAWEDLLVVIQSLREEDLEEQ